MAVVILREPTAADAERILALNDAEVAQTSAMDRARLEALAALACRFTVVEADGRVVAFLLAMDHAAPYDNDNFRWFAARYPRFAYVDRIVVDAAAAGMGIGGRLYRDLLAHACQRGLERVVCEYNLDPPNPASQAFHDRFGFVEVGRQHVAGGSKLVSLQQLVLAPEATQ
jgi:predicted GNAT superfamily acetyltransferase